MTSEIDYTNSIKLIGLIMRNILAIDPKQATLLIACGSVIV